MLIALSSLVILGLGIYSFMLKQQIEDLKLENDILKELLDKYERK